LKFMWEFVALGFKFLHEICINSKNVAKKCDFAIPILQILWYYNSHDFE